MLLLISTWLFWLIVCYGHGAILASLYFRFSAKPKTAFPLSFFSIVWLGFFHVVLLAQLWHFVAPVNLNCVLTLAAISTLGYALGRPIGTAVWESGRPLKGKGLVLRALTAVVVSCASLTASQPVSMYDTHLYHFNVVRWITDYPIVPGLGNLHNRLALNNLFHIFAALCDVSVWRDKAAHLALGFMFSVATIASTYRHSNFERIFCSVTLFYLLEQLFSPHSMASLSTDLSASLLVLVTLKSFFSEDRLRVPLVVTSASLAVTFKVSMLPILLLAVINAYYYATTEITSRTIRLRAIFILSFMPFWLIIPFLMRNIILSGWILYPLPVAQISLPWAMPRAEVQDIYDWIVSWARWPSHKLEETLHSGFFAWFKPWGRTFLTTWASRYLWYGTFSLVAAYWSGIINFDRSDELKRYYSALLITGLGILLWFKAPDIRFGEVWFWAFLALTLFPWINSELATNPRLSSLIMITGLVLFSPNYFNNLLNLGPKPIFLIAPDAPVFGLDRLDFQQDDSNQTLYKPKSGDQCGNSPIPCTPYRNNYRLIVPGRIESGFLPG